MCCGCNVFDVLTRVLYVVGATIYIVGVVVVHNTCRSMLRVQLRHHPQHNIYPQCVQSIHNKYNCIYCGYILSVRMYCGCVYIVNA